MSQAPNATQATVAGVQDNRREKYLEPKGPSVPGNGASLSNELTATSQTGLMGSGGQPIGRQISVTLTPEQFEQLYLQPGGVGGKGDLSKRLGNPTPLGIAGFLLCLTPLSIYLMNFGSTNGTISPLAAVGAFFALGGVCMILAGIMEWILGNTFPFVVFTTFGGFWVAFAILNNPPTGLATAAGTSAASLSAFYEGIAVYLVCWGVLVFMYLLGSLRTNMAFVALFLFLDITFFLLSAAYFRIGEGRTDFNILLKAGGGFAFATTICGWYIMLCLVLGSTGMPFNVPLGDLSGSFTRKKQ